MKSLILIIPIFMLAGILMSGCATPQDVYVPPTPIGLPVPPTYPAEMKRQGITGNVLIQFTVDKNGVPRDIKIVHSSRTEFEKPAIEAVEKWRFNPAQRNGENANSNGMRIPISFNLEDTGPK